MSAHPKPGQPPKLARIRLKAGREKSVEQGHPWLFSGAVADGPADAPLVRVETSKGKPLATGFFNPKGQIRARLLGPAGLQVDRAFFAARLAEAAKLRRAVLPDDTTGYRLFNAEGDGVPGWTVDRYGDVLVSQITNGGLEALRDEAYAALRELHPEAAIVQANRIRARKDERLPTEDETIHGDVPESTLFTESGLTFEAEIAGGQKTGFYCDQRPNREIVRGLAGGRSVLDLFTHSGAFSLYALRGGARQVTAVDSAERLLEIGRRHLDLNGLAADQVEWVKANAYQDLRHREETYDLVVCDPPPLATRRSHLDKGARSYKDLNRLALGRVAPGGFLLTFSCSAAVDTKLFRQILFSAALEAGRRVALLRPLSAGADPPVAITHPQGEYLKGWLVCVTGEQLSA